MSISKPNIISQIAGVNPKNKLDDEEADDNEDTIGIDDDDDVGGDEVDIDDDDDDDDNDVDIDADADIDADIDIDIDADIDEDADADADPKEALDEYGNFIFDGTTEPDDDIGFSKKLGINSFSDADYYNNVTLKPILTSKYLTRFEKIRVISERITMLTNGAPSTIPDISDKTNLEIANLELKHGKLPFIIQRRLPNGKTENISVNTLIDIL